MAGLTGIVHWDGSAAEVATIRAMLDTIRHRGPDGLFAAAHGSVGLGHARLALDVAERRQPQPVSTPDGRYRLVADARLSNRRDLLQALATTAWLGDAPIDAEILVAAYARWGDEAVQALRGDFAFAVWDDATRTLYAARDPFGVKPFFYTTDAARFAFGSEPKALLALPGFRAIPDEAALVELLVTGRPRATEATFHAGITRLRAAHALHATAQGVRVTRWWNPGVDEAPARHLSDDEYPRRFYLHLRQAVARALDVDVPVAIELSGGYDSSSIVVTAADLHADPRCALPPIHTLSQRYPGLPCDEGEMIDAVRAVSPFPAIRFDVAVADPTRGFDAEFHKSDAPLVEISWERRESESQHLAAAGCRVVLTGIGGDELSWDPDFAADLWRSRRYLAALRYCLTDPRVRRDRDRRACLLRLMRFAAPAAVKRFVRRVRPAAATPLPPWLTARAGAVFRAHEAAARAGAVPRSSAQEAVRRWLDAPEFQALLEDQERQSAWCGIERRHPFLDRDLVEYVLAIPWQARYRQPGAFKTLLVRALGTRLPERIRDRNGKTVFDAYFLALHRAGAASLRAQLEATGHGACGALVEREALLAAVERSALPGAPTTFGEVSLPLAAALVEFWWRRLAPHVAGCPPAGPGEDCA